MSAPQEFGRLLIASWTPEFLARHPGVKLELNVTDRNVDIIREGYDLAIRMGVLRDTELISRKLADRHWILLASPAYLEKRGRPETIEDLRSHSCVRHLTAGRPWPFKFADGESIVPDGQFDTDDSGSIRQAALNSAGIAYQLRMTVTDFLKTAAWWKSCRTSPCRRFPPMHCMRSAASCLFAGGYSSTSWSRSSPSSIYKPTKAVMNAACCSRLRAATSSTTD